MAGQPNIVFGNKFENLGDVQASIELLIGHKIEVTDEPIDFWLWNQDFPEISFWEEQLEIIREIFHIDTHRFHHDLEYFDKPHRLSEMTYEPQFYSDIGESDIVLETDVVWGVSLTERYSPSCLDVMGNPPSVFELDLEQLEICKKILTRRIPDGKFYVVDTSY